MDILTPLEARNIVVANIDSITTDTLSKIDLTIRDAAEKGMTRVIYDFRTSDLSSEEQPIVDNIKTSLIDIEYTVTKDSELIVNDKTFEKILIEWDDV